MLANRRAYSTRLAPRDPVVETSVVDTGVVLSSRLVVCFVIVTNPVEPST